MSTEEAVRAHLMRELKGTPGWACYELELTRILDAQVERCLQGTAEEFEKSSGKIEGLRTALNLPEHIIRRSTHV